jgi:hypothetical protein
MQTIQPTAALTLFLSLLLASLSALPVSGSEYERRVATVRQVPGLVAFWDFVNRVDGRNASGNFLAYTAPCDTHRYVLEPRNISYDFWQQGPQSTLADFPL